MATRGKALTFSSLCCFILLWVSSCAETDTLLKGQQLRDGQYLVSAFGVFRLGFVIYDSRFSALHYLGISYNTRKWQEDSFYEENKVVWVANRNTPISDDSGVLTIDGDDCNLKILHSVRDPIAFTSVRGVTNTSATLLENGNFVLRELHADGSTGRVLWQSFDYPTDTLLPGMKLGVDLRTGHKWSLTSARDYGTHAAGSYSLGLDTNGTKQLIMWWLGNVYWTSGTWLNGRFNFSPELSPEGGLYNFSYISNENESYFQYSVNEDVTPFPFLTIDYDGELVSKGTYGSVYFLTCDSNFLGAKMPLGCVRKEYPICRNSYSYFDSKYGLMSGVGFKFSAGENMTLSDCGNKCFFNCSCIAYASTNKDDTGCEIWTNQTTFQESKTNDARQINIIASEEKKWWSLWWWWLLIALSGAVAISLLSYSCHIALRKLKAKVKSIKERKLLLRELRGKVSAPTMPGQANEEHEKDERNRQGHELEIFCFETIASAANNFSVENKLGEGGFGPVYKGQLPDGQKIAIKRLSKSSGQGLVEFKNEAILIARLQHTNLVRLLGCCVQREERILIYEYLPKKSLDFFLFSSTERNLLNWKHRLDIIEGIAQGLLYLHKYSRLRVIHRDLKASNILLDDKMNPKISDFGMAKIFGLNQSEANTNRIVGTYGYMSPEYAMSGVVSTKTDVYSFGVLLLEIVSGKKNNGCYHPEHPINLVGYAWQLWNEGRASELLDPTLEESCAPSEVLRCINVGLLCVQECPTDRPDMSDVVFMLTNEAMLLAVPKKPAFYYIGYPEKEPEEVEMELENTSRNDITISVMEAR